MLEQSIVVVIYATVPSAGWWNTVWWWRQSQFANKTCFGSWHWWSLSVISSSRVRRDHLLHQSKQTASFEGIAEYSMCLLTFVPSLIPHCHSKPWRQISGAPLKHLLLQSWKVHSAKGIMWYITELVLGGKACQSFSRNTWICQSDRFDRITSTILFVLKGGSCKKSDSNSCLAWHLNVLFSCKIHLWLKSWHEKVFIHC